MFLPRADIRASVLYERLRSFSSPQRSEISQILKDIDNDLDDCASEISALEAGIAFLHSQRERLQNHKLYLSTLLSPIHCLPNELLTEIFTFACVIEGLDIDSIQSANKQTFDIATVCCRWRCLAISCSELWSNIELGLPVAESELEVQHGYLDLFLSRSKQHLLTLFISLADETPRDDALLAKVLEHAPRWQSLALETSIEPDNLPILYSTPFPSLETLELCTGDDEFLQSTWNSFPSINLRTISTASLSFLGNITPPPPLLNGVTSLSFSPEIDDLFEPLKWFPNLLHLSLHPHFIPIETGPLDGSPCSVSVTSLEISFYSWETSICEVDLLMIAMDLLTAPALSTLVIASEPSELIEFAQSTLLGSFSHIYSFIERSGCSLTVLELRELSIVDSYVVDLLRHLHSLVDLSLEDPETCTQSLDYPISKELIESLHTHRQSSLQHSCNPILPNLRSLVLIVRKMGFHSLSFIGTISSRWIPDNISAEKIGVVCLRSVELHLPEPPNEAEYLSLAPFEQLGMRIVVKQEG